MSSFLKFVKRALLEDFCDLHRVPRPLWSINILIKAQVLMSLGTEVKSTFGPIGFYMFHTPTAHRSMPSVQGVQMSVHCLSHIYLLCWEILTKHTANDSESAAVSYAANSKIFLGMDRFLIQCVLIQCLQMLCQTENPSRASRPVPAA